MKISKIISGGQTGVDRAALDAAIELDIEHGGFVPKGRLSEDGSIPLKYNIIELENEDYSARTLKNVQYSDGTLILHKGEITGGTALTEEFCYLEKKAVLTINILDEFTVIRVNLDTWLDTKWCGPIIGTVKLLSTPEFLANNCRNRPLSDGNESESLGQSLAALVEFV